MSQSSNPGASGRTTSAATLGIKRRCLSCNGAFFDLNRSPIVCVRCGETFQPVLFPRSPPRAAAILRAKPAMPSEPELEEAESTGDGKGETVLLETEDEEESEIRTPAQEF